MAFSPWQPVRVPTSNSKLILSIIYQTNRNRITWKVHHGNKKVTNGKVGREERSKGGRREGLGRRGGEEEWEEGIGRKEGGREWRDSPMLTKWIFSVFSMNWKAISMFSLFWIGRRGFALGLQRSGWNGRNGKKKESTVTVHTTIIKGSVFISIPFKMYLTSTSTEFLNEKSYQSLVRVPLVWGQRWWLP